ncbi:MAG: adenylate/guanylate cyclase domain-containing protein [Spirochaetota bacterium]
MANEFLKMDKSRLFALLISIIIFVFLALVYSRLSLFDAMENSAVDFKFYLKAPDQRTEKINEGATLVKKNPKARNDLIILGIDETTIRTFNGTGINWPFPWNVHAKLAKFVGSGNPLAVFFDIMFLDHKEHEKEFAEAIKSTKSVFLDYSFETAEYDKKYPDIDARMGIVNKNLIARDPNDNFSMWVEEAVPPVPALAGASTGVGFANVRPDIDHINRKMPLIIKYNEKKGMIINSLIEAVNKQAGLSVNRLDLKKNIKKLGINPDKYSEILKNVSESFGVTGDMKLNSDNFSTLDQFLDYLNNKMSSYYPSIDLLLVMQYYGITNKDIEVKMGDYIKLKNLPPDKMAKPNSAREIRIPVDEQGFMDINFIGGFGSFNYYPYLYFHQDGKFNNPSLQNKILLVAAFASTGIATDRHKSPYGDLYGIEHHANTLNTILNQDFIKKLNTWQNILILLVIAIIMGLFLSRLSIVKSIILTAVLILVYIVGSQVLFETKNLIFIYFTALLQIGVTFALIISYRVVTEQKEKRYIRQTFSKLVAKSVVDELLKDPEKLKLGGEKKPVTVLFSDIRGFTSLTEKMPSEALVQHLNEYLEAMSNVIIKYEGTLDKYIGDAIMAFWGAPIPQENHALLACRAAVEMMEVLKKMNEEWVNRKPEPKQPLNIGIGLNTGDMHVALMGSSTRMNYTLIGDNVNLGSRVEGLNKEYKTNIIITEFTYEQVKNDIIARELDLVRVKGKALPAKIYELIDMK